MAACSWLLQGNMPWLLKGVNPGTAGEEFEAGSFAHGGEGIIVSRCCKLDANSSVMFAHLVGFLMGAGLSRLQLSRHHICCVVVQIFQMLDSRVPVMTFVAGGP